MERQLDLLPGDPGQRADPALADQHGAEAAAASRGAEDLGRRGLGLGEQRSTARISSSATRWTPVGPAERNLPLKAMGRLRQGRASGSGADLGSATRQVAGHPDPGRSRESFGHGGTAMPSTIL